MAKALNIFISGVALVVSSFFLLIAIILGNAMMTPIIQLIQANGINSALGIGDITYIPFLVYGFAFIFEILAFVAFVMSALSREEQQVDEWGI